jgi:hypothetical protein
MNRKTIKVIFILSIPILLIQIPLRDLTEPYPAILLPDGASTIKEEKKGTITFDQWQIIAQSASGRQYEVDMDKLLQDVPVQYRKHIVNHRFGLPTKESEVITMSGASEEGKIWIKKRLQDILGPDSFTRLKIVEYQITKPADNSTPPQREVIEMAEIPL